VNLDPKGQRTKGKGEGKSDTTRLDPKTILIYGEIVGRNILWI
jgi:hypothetical protein